MVVTTRLRLEDFLAMPRIEEERLELIDGEVYEKPMPRWGHARQAGQLVAELNRFGFAGVEARAIIPAAGDLEASAPLPDVAFYRHNPPADDEWMSRPPHVAIEILSLGQSRTEMRTKVEVYLRFGVESVWVVDPERHLVDVYEAGARRTLSGDDILQSPAAPGFALRVADLLSRA